MSRLIKRIIMGIILIAALAGAVALHLQRDSGKIVAYSTAPVKRGDLLVSISAIGILLGLPPAELAPELSLASAIPAASPAVPLGLPSDVLRRRPDIRRAEADIHAATARIRVASAELFPRFTITGAVGVRSGDFSSWLPWAQRFWSFGPAAIEQQQALQQQTLIAYRQTLLTALQEFENALITSAGD
jgi:outer membrane protein TolC